MGGLNSFGNCIGQHSECVSRPMSLFVVLPYCSVVPFIFMGFGQITCFSRLPPYQEVIDAQLGGEVNMVFEISQTDSGDT